MITYNRKNSSGFTLIEVLVAALIAFISLSVFTLVFRGAIIANTKAESALLTSSIATLVTSEISSEITSNKAQNSLSGKGELLEGTYFWEARVIETIKPPVRFVGAEISQAEHRLKKWQVSFSVTVKGRSREYQYEDISW